MCIFKFPDVDEGAEKQEFSGNVKWCILLGAANGALYIKYFKTSLLLIISLGICPKKIARDVHED